MKSNPSRHNPCPASDFGLRTFYCIVAIVFGALAHTAAAAPLTVTVDATHPGPRINPAMWGIFFEDINFGADGGLYAELVKNRSFEFPEPLMGWSKLSSADSAGSITIRNDEPFSAANPHYLRLSSTGGTGTGISNNGFRGMGIREDEAYAFSVQARAANGSTQGLRIQLVGSGGTVLASAQLQGFTPQWKKHMVLLRASGTDPKARLTLLLEGPGTLDLDMVSLFPQHTWKNRPGGLRADLVQMLADMKPGFMRFPGGCIVEGRYLTNRYEWKTTIGALEERQLIINRWNDEFKHRPTPDYYQSFGLGFFEFFQLCEDIGAEPLPILNCGMACQFNSGELAALDQLDPYVQDALDLIEFANGSVDSPWGRRRAAMGHPAPFHLKLLGIGNEQWGEQYFERYARFAQVLKQRHPEVQLVSSAGPSPADDRFRLAWDKLRPLHADIVDEHCYAAPQWFLDNANRYDRYDRSGPKVFMGEYAAQSVTVGSPENRNTLECAIAEAAYMTGLERNADVVRMASYAPLFGHSDAWQWTPDLIWCDNLRVYGTPSYYVQQLFSRNRGDLVLPVTVTDTRPPAVPAGRIGLCTYHTSAEFKDVRVTRQGKTLFAPKFDQGCADWSPLGGKWGVTDGVYRQSDLRAITASLAGEPGWADYTLSLKARKLAGDEGFIVIVRNHDRDSQVQWNLGGWGNRQHGIQVQHGGADRIIAQVPGFIETGRWYDIKVDLKGSHVDCYLDGKLVQSADAAPPTAPRLFASASQEEKSGQLILKVVNPSNEAVGANLRLDGISKTAVEAQATVLTGAGPADQNSFEQPGRIAPVTTAISGAGSNFVYRFKPWSLTVLRIPASAH